jgi:hypothetical protein
MLGVIDRIAALMGSTGPLHWLTVGPYSEPVGLYEIEGRTYLIDIHPPRVEGWNYLIGPRSSKGWASEARVHGRGTLTTGRTDTDVMLTEVTDSAVKHQVVIAYAAKKPKTLIATGDHKRRKPESMLVILGLAKDDTPDGLAAAVPHVTVFEVTPA